jgi:thymidine phosphorylase
MILPQEIIRAKRDGETLSAGEIGDFIGGLASGAVTEGQAAAFAMAVFFRGMTLDERVALTRAMTASGSSLEWGRENLPGPILDKHSTGGVGDNVSLMLAPMLAACGGFVPMISGRGLGHTGGTLDKLDSIPGYVSQPDLALFKRAVKEAGCAIIGQTAELAPADRRLYAIRDVTATVESVALITASILSKKLTAGLQGLVMDVKTGSGAFMPTLSAARELAESIAAVASDAGLPTVSLITDMNEPLASAAGNAVEVRNAVDYLTGARRDPRLDRVTMALGAELLALSGLAPDAEAGEAALRRALASGAAAERFERMVAALSGPKDFVSRAHHILPRAPVLVDAMPERKGFVAGIDVRAVGVAVVAMGGGRARAADAIDPAVGLSELAPIGAEVGPDAPLARIHARTPEEAAAAATRLRAAYRLAEAPLSPDDPMIERIAGTPPFHEGG